MGRVYQRLHENTSFSHMHTDHQYNFINIFYVNVTEWRNVWLAELNTYTSINIICRFFFQFRRH